MARQIDILIYVALNEEFTYLAEALGIDLEAEELKTLPITIYHGSLKGPNSKQVSICVVPAGKMGNTNSGILTAWLLSELNPINVVVLGIAGAISSDLTPGGVFIPFRVDEYLANAAAVGAEQNEFQLSGNYFETNGRLSNRFSNFAMSHRSAFQDWQSGNLTDLKSLVPAEIIQKLLAIGVDLTKSGLMAGDDRQLASGPAVVKGAAFAKWLKNVADRKIAAVEMESAGVYAATSSLIDGPRVIAIRPISDIADERKQQIEEIAGDTLRLFALSNAVRLLTKSIEVGIFEPEGQTAKIKPAALIKRAFIVGGKLESPGTDRSDRGDLNTTCYEIGKQLAKAKIDLIACSPFDDSADYYAIMGFASSADGGKIYLHYPQHDDVIKHKEQLLATLKDKNVQVIPFVHPGYDSPDEQGQAWSFCQLQVLEQAEAVIAIGGKLSKSANLTLRIAEVKKQLIIPFTFLNGAAELIYRNINWQDLYPSLDAALVNSSAGIAKLPEIIRQMKLNTVQRQTNTFAIADKYSSAGRKRITKLL